MVERSGWIWVSVGLLCGLFMASTVAVYYYGEYTKCQSLYEATLQDLESLSMRVSILIDYGNGSREWHNNTRVPLGANLLNVSLMVAEIEYTVSEWGAFVNTMNGVGGDSGWYWLWYYWDSTSSQWKMGAVGSNAYILLYGDIMSWVYKSF